MSSDTIPRSEFLEKRMMSHNRHAFLSAPPDNIVLPDDQTPRRLVYRRGYGNVVSTVFSKNAVNTTAVPYNRLQPLCGAFGHHYPQTADPGYTQPNPQTTIAWDSKQQAPQCGYQNATIALERMPQVNSHAPIVDGRGLYY